ncbi:MAG: SapC family protein [Gammaproteobacteria bacterium]|nr:SapC family protein [Gammaproteobacteria bacterium]MBU1556873.1 SapC family protein [Gammaproteobacteria bacterium]MBU2070968.1 SapC family protein [Gammaproteobacteria bacterium]MBU2183794.1 SapC family protein [Gammaproteobacteria bacterium]MBU2206507.1 SapC family protein [Gammaproteobacteria bacterium]
MTNIVALDSQQHQHYKLSEDKLFSHTRTAHILPLAVTEFVAAAVSLPIVFVKDSTTGQFRACALTGLQPGQNLCWQESGWQAAYIPLAVRNYPLLALKPEAQSDDYIIAVDTGSELFNQQSGQALFAADKGTDYLQQRARSAINQAHGIGLTQQFINRLLALELLVARTLTLTPKGAEPYELTGMYGIDEQRLAQLTAEQWLSLRANNDLLAIHAVLMSMAQLPLLVARLA